MKMEKNEKSLHNFFWKAGFLMNRYCKREEKFKKISSGKCKVFKWKITHLCTWSFQHSKRNALECLLEKAFQYAAEFFKYTFLQLLFQIWNKIFHSVVKHFFNLLYRFFCIDWNLKYNFSSIAEASEWKICREFFIFIYNFSIYSSWKASISTCTIRFWVFPRKYAIKKRFFYLQSALYKSAIHYLKSF